MAWNSAPFLVSGELTSGVTRLLLQSSIRSYCCNVWTIYIRLNCWHRFAYQMFKIEYSGINLLNTFWQAPFHVSLCQVNTSQVTWVRCFEAPGTPPKSSLSCAIGIAIKNLIDWKLNFWVWEYQPQSSHCCEPTEWTGKKVSANGVLKKELLFKANISWLMKWDPKAERRHLWSWLPLTTWGRTHHVWWYAGISK